MIVIKKVLDSQNFSKENKAKGLKLGLVPTMGALHEGHLSLVEYAKNFADIVVVSIFVNPLQFAPNEDFNKYPRTFESDSEKLNKAQCDAVFYPNVAELYPEKYKTVIRIGGQITEKFEGEFRPGHFDGVSTIVAKLFNSTLPDVAVFGQKDYQQSLLIKKMVKDLNFPVEILVAPTIREGNGLAKSSRNQYLNLDEYNQASIIFITIQKAKEAIEKGEKNRKVINAIMHQSLRTNSNIKIDYAASALDETLETPEQFQTGDTVVLLIAVYLGKTRLIDNSIIKIA